LRGEGWGEGGYLGDNSSKSAVASLRFGILCRFTEQKGIPYILEALRMYRARHGAVDFTFAGQGPLEGLIRETIDLRPWTLDQKEGREAADGELRAKDGEGEPLEGRSRRGSVAPICDRSARRAAHSAVLQGRGDGMAAHPASVTGSGEARSAVPHQDRSNVYGLKSKVYGPGIRIVPVSSAVAVLDQMDVFVHPGLDDAMPVSIVEALMCGVPCIVSDVGASPEVVRDGIEGKVIKPASAAAILEAMEWFAAMTAEELAAFKKRARERYEECCRPEVVGSRVAVIYREVRGRSTEVRKRHDHTT
jgi:glycosyltransferase involved in cell wall biosynthesis